MNVIIINIMQTLQITGTTTYADNIRNLKIGDTVKLIRNPTNKISADAIGVYTLDGLKVGYTPFKESQINIKSKYTVSKINLLSHQPLVLLSYEYEPSNFIQIEPGCILELRDINEITFTDDVKIFKKYLKVSDIDVEQLGITYQDDNYINLLMNDDIFYTVTRKYYEDNIFKYDEFYKFKLIPKCIYQQFQIHRLEVYLKRKYKTIESLLMKKIKLDDYDFIEKQFQPINDKLFDNLNSDQLENFLKLIVQNNIEPNEYYNPKLYFKLISNIDIDINYNIEMLKTNFNELKIGGICYNHEYKRYCFIDLYDENNIVDISTRKISKEYVKELIIKLLISNKNIINIFNPITGKLYTKEISEIIKDSVKL